MFTNKEFRDYYKILQVEKNASQTEIRKAYYKLAKENHPDKFAEGNRENATKIFQIIGEAYDTLFDVQKRHLYDYYCDLPKNNDIPVPQPKVKVFVEVTGKVVYVNTKNRSIFHLFAPNSNKKFTCIYEDFFPIKLGDVVCGVAEYISSKEKLIFSNAPFCIQGRDDETIIDFICSSLSNKRGFSLKKISQILNILIHRSVNKDLDTSINMLDSISVYLKYSNNEDISNLNIGDLNPYQPFSQIITLKQFNKLISSWYKGRVLRNLYLLGLNNREINASKMNPLKLYEKCLENPYTITNLSLEKADGILERCGKKINENFRQCGKIIRKISELMENNGWTGIPTDILLRIFPDFKNYAEMLTNDFGMMYDLNTIYLNYAYEVETGVAEWIKDLLSLPPICIPADVAFTRSDLSDDQKGAIIQSLNNNISIITGPGGSGKSHTIKEIVYNLERNGISYRIASFTGKAVARVREIIGKKEPATLHMMIALSKSSKGGNPSDTSNKDPFKYLILDEASMITTELLYEFRKHFKHNFRLVFVGDCNQLQPIGWGSLFESLINSKIVPLIRLTTVHRTDNNLANGIFLNSQKIIEHKDEYYNGPPFDFTITSNFKVIEGDLTIVQKLIETLSNNGVPSSKIVIISPYNRDLETINNNCSNLYNGSNRSLIDARGKKWRINDRVIATENNYKNNVLTGDEGIILDLTSSDELENGLDKDNVPMILVKFKNSTQKYFTCEVIEDEEGGKELNTQQLILSFACSVHRLQGSEADYVIGYIPKGSPSSSFLNANLLYTLITRAKKIVWLIGDCETMERAAITRPPYRCENLTKRLSLEEL